MSQTTYDVENKQMLMLIEELCDEYKAIVKQIKRLEKKDEQSNNIVSNKSREEFSDKQSYEVIDSAFEDEISFYLEAYQDLDDDFDLEDLIDTLPRRRHYKYREILLRLQAESLKELKEIEEIILENKEIAKDELAEYYNLQEIQKRKIRMIKELMIPVTEDEVFEEEKNQIVLVPTLSGNIRLIDELEHIPSEYYSAFLELIESIIEGTFKRVKRFTNHRELIGVNEVKGNKVRVVFTRIDKNTYALITAFVKKCNNDKLYKESLCSKVNDYHLVEDFLKNNLRNESFLRENSLAIERLFDLIAEKNNEKRLKK